MILQLCRMQWLLNHFSLAWNFYKPCSPLHLLILFKMHAIFVCFFSVSLSFQTKLRPNLMWNFRVQISPVHKTIHFSQLLKRNLLSETTDNYFTEFNNNNKLQNMFKVNNRKTICHSVVFIVNFEFIWHVILACFFFCFFLLTLNM